MKKKQTYRSLNEESVYFASGMEWIGWYTSGVSQETKVMHTFDGNFHSPSDIPWKNMKIANIPHAACGRVGLFLCVHKWISEQVIRAMLARLHCVCIKHLKRFHISWLMSMVCDIHSWNMHSILCLGEKFHLFFSSSHLFIPLSLQQTYSRPCGSFRCKLSQFIEWQKIKRKKMNSWHTALEPSSFILHRWWHTHGRWRQIRTLKRVRVNAKEMETGRSCSKTENWNAIV